MYGRCFTSKRDFFWAFAVLCCVLVLFLYHSQLSERLTSLEEFKRAHQEQEQNPGGKSEGVLHTEQGLTIPKYEVFEYEQHYTQVPDDDWNVKQPGDMGKPVKLPENATEEERQLEQQLFKEQALNQYVSDLIPVHRRLPDVRDPWCTKEQQLLKALPQVTIVIVFYNEAWSVLVRTVHSILDRSPKELIKEILLVDDYSSHA